MQGWFTAKEYQVGLLLGPGKQPEPLANGRKRQGGGTVLGRIDVAVAAGQIAGGEQVKEDIALPGLKAHGPRLGQRTHD